MVPSRIHFHCATTGTPHVDFLHFFTLLLFFFPPTHWIIATPVFKFIDFWLLLELALDTLHVALSHSSPEFLLKLVCFILFYLFILSFVFLGLYSQHMEGPRLGFDLELQLLAYTTATAMPDPSCVCDVHHGSQQRWILNLLSKATDRFHGC